MIVSATPENIRAVAAALSNNQVIGLPTETVYGLAGNALSTEAVNKIYRLKDRPSTNPLIVHISDFDQIYSLIGELTTRQTNYLNQLKVFWPGPLTIILPKSPAVPKIVTAGNDNVAIRIPNHPIALRILREANLPLAAPSANRANYISPTTAQHVLDEFGEQLDFIVDGGSCLIGLESTVVSLVTDVPQILRPGAITLGQLKQVIPEIQLETKVIASDQQQISPGQQIKHYSPRTKLIFKKDYVPTNDLKKIAYIAFSPLSEVAQNEFFSYKLLSANSNLNEIAQKIFAILRELDKQNLDLIVIDSCPEEQLGLAIMDRLKRAIN